MNTLEFWVLFAVGALVFLRFIRNGTCKPTPKPPPRNIYDDYTP